MLRKITTLTLTALLCLGVVFSAAQAADEKEPAKAAKVTATTKAYEAIAAADTLAEIGRKENAPEMLLAAARVIGKANFKKLDIKDAKTKSQISEADPLAEANTLIEDAIKMAGDNAAAVKTLAAAIREDIKVANRGAQPGPQTRNGFIQKGVDNMDDFFIRFQGLDPARVSVANLTNNGDIDLYVYNSAGKLVASDSRVNAGASVNFYPMKTETFKVVVRAYSSKGPMRYRLTTN